MQKGAILIIPLFTYDFDEARLVVNAALKLIVKGSVCSVVISSHFGLWEVVKKVALETDSKITVTVPYNPSNDAHFFEDVAKRLVTIKAELKEVLLLSLERSGQRYKTLIWEIYQANIVKFQCTFWIKILLIKPLSSYYHDFLEMLKGWCCQRKWSGNES